MQDSTGCNNSASLKNEAVSGATEDSSFDVSEEVEGKKQEEDAGAEEEILQKNSYWFVFCVFVFVFFLVFLKHLRFFFFSSLSRRS